MRSALSKGHQRIEQYLREMEVPTEVFSAMMKTPPDEVQLLDWIGAKALFGGVPAEKQLVERYNNRFNFQMPPSIYDWLISRCPGARDDYRAYKAFEQCLHDQFDAETVRRAKLAIGK